MRHTTFLAGGQRVLSMTLQAADTVSSILAPLSTPAAKEAKEADLAKMVLVAGATVPARAPAAAPAPPSAVGG